MLKIKRSLPRNIVIIVSFFTLFLAYSLLQPRISGLFPFIREAKLQAFLNSIEKSKSISSQEFWQFREFYYPGSVTLDRNGIEGKIKPLLFFQFRSKYMLSSEYLITTSDLNQIIPFGENYIINVERSYAYKISDKNVEIIFIKPISELTKANGFIYEKDQDKKLVEGKYWLVITKILK